MAFFNGDSPEASMLRQQANCTCCGTPIVFEKGAGLARKHGIENNVVMCHCCHSVFDVLLVPGRMTLTQDVSNQYGTAPYTYPKPSGEKTRSSTMPAPAIPFFRRLDITLGNWLGVPIPKNENQLSALCCQVQGKSKACLLSLWVLSYFGLFQFYAIYLNMKVAAVIRLSFLISSGTAHLILRRRDMLTFPMQLTLCLLIAIIFLWGLSDLIFLMLKPQSEYNCTD